MKQKWIFKAPLGSVDSTPLIADLDHNGQKEMILTTTGGSVIVLDAKGQQIWMRGVQIPITISATAVDLVEDSNLEILVLNQAGTLYCLSSHSGDVIWKVNLPGKIEWGTTSIVATDLDQDGSTEIIAGDMDGHIICVSQEGEILWQYSGNHGITFCPAAGSLEKNRDQSILISGSKIPLICLDSKGKEQWRINKKGKGSSPILVDLEGDGHQEIITTIDSTIIAVDRKGKILWTVPMKKEIDSSLCAGDVDEDGIIEIYAIDLSGQFVAISPQGKILWTNNLRARVRRSPSLGDIDGDGEIDIVAAGYSSELFIFTSKGVLKKTHAMQLSTNSSPIIADFYGNGLPTVIYTPSNGAVNAYQWTEAKTGSKIIWPQYRFNTARKAEFKLGTSLASVSFQTIEPGDLYSGSNQVKVTLLNSEELPLKVQFSITLGNRKTKVTTFEKKDKIIDLSVKYLIDSEKPTQVDIQCEIFHKEKLVAQRSIKAYVVPFRKEISDLTLLLKEVKHISKGLPDTYWLQGQISATEKRIQNYRQQAAISGTLNSVTRRELRDALGNDINAYKRNIALYTTARNQYLIKEWPILLSSANPWAPFGGMEEIVEKRLLSAEININAFSGETESAALNIFNFGQESLQARVEIDPFTNGGTTVPSRKIVKSHEVIDVPTQTLDYSADALPLLNQANVIILPQWNARQLWLNIDTKALSPGIWKSKVRIKTLEIESREFTASLTVHVWNSSLPKKMALKHCNWGYVYNSRHKEYEDESIQDRAAHGNNVFVTGFVPNVKYDKDGNIIGEIDYSRHDDFVKKYSPHGLILFQPTGGLSGPGGNHGEAYHKAYVSRARAWVKHLAKMGVNYDQYAMYPVDEPGLRDGLVEIYLHYAKLFREADPKIKMYTDPVSRITKEQLTEMVPYVDIWCPNRVGFLLHSGADKLEIMRKSKGEIWTYECEGNAKHLSPIGYYRSQSWLAWHHDLTGIGFWSYSTSGADPWFKPSDTLDYLLTYQGNSVVSSKRWEAVRDGMEEYSMLAVLKKTVQEIKKENGNSDAVKKAEFILGNGASSIAQFCGLDKDGTTPGRTGLKGVRKLADQRWKAIQTIRKEIAESLDELKASQK